MNGPGEHLGRINALKRAAGKQLEAVLTHDPLVAVDGILDEVQAKGLPEISGIVEVAAKELEIAMLPGKEHPFVGEDTTATLKRHDMTDLIESLRSLAGLKDEEMLTRLRTLKQTLMDNRRRA
jgi:hypothetical protein